jgi:hypothetical protein
MEIVIKNDFGKLCVYSSVGKYHNLKYNDWCIFWNDEGEYDFGMYDSSLKNIHKYYARHDIYRSIQSNYWGDFGNCSISDLEGMIFTGYEKDSDYLMFFTNDNRVVLFNHEQQCCESVYLADITGDLDDLIGSEILQASCETKDASDDDKSSTWTFYKFATRKGYVDLRWIGESNGYYSESVNCTIIKLNTCIDVD